MSDMLITRDVIEDLAAGSAFLGTGGGGDPYVGALLCKTAIDRYGPVALRPLGDVSDEAHVACVAAIGAPTVLIEKLLSVEDADAALTRMERLLGFQTGALLSAEIGGINSTLPIACAAMRGLPVLDADGMGRAFPKLEMTTFNIAGVSASPVTLANEHGEFSIIEARDSLRTEEMARPMVAALGASAIMSAYKMDGATAKRASVPGSLSAAIAIGRAINGSDSVVPPLQRLLQALRDQDLYRNAFVLFQGKIVDVARRTTGGFVFGHCGVAAITGGDSVRVEFQNENLVVRQGERVLAIVPDLITVVDTESGRAIPTEALRYGQRVSIVGCSAPHALRTEAALKVVSPANFGLPDPFTPIETIHTI